MTEAVNPWKVLVVVGCLIWELMLYKFKLDYNTRWFKKFVRTSMIRQGQVSLKPMDFEAMLQAVVTNPANSTQSIRQVQHLTVQCDSSHP